MILCNHAGINRTEWVLDSGATDHMTYVFDQLVESKTLKEKSKIILPNGHTSEISSIGKVQLSNDLILQDVLYIPAFKYNLLSIPKLTKDNNCIVIFHLKFCVIQDYVNKRILGIARECRGLYMLKDKPLDGVDSKFQHIIQQLLEVDKEKLFLVGSVDRHTKLNGYELWHKRLSHAPYHKLKHMTQLQLQGEGNKICVTCPMEKFTRLPSKLVAVEATLHVK